MGTKTRLGIAAFIVLSIGVVVWLMNWSFNLEDVGAQSQRPVLGNVLLESSGNQFESVTISRQLEFPRDHGSHPEFQTEWWYLTGNLKNNEGRQFGYQFTVFRRALSRDLPELNSDWATSQAYLAHAGITDVQSKMYLVDEIYSRGALNLAGVRTEPFSIWVENWRADGSVGQCAGCLTLSIKAESNDFSFSLDLDSAKPAVLHGEGGVSRKSTIPGNASYYYSLSRLRTSGTLTIQEENITVSGDSWMDHEWFSSVLDEGQSGWDWFSLQFDDQRELMLFQVRNHDPAVEPFKYGVVVDQRGQSELIPPDQITLTPVRVWKSNLNHSEYPVDWKIEIPSHNLQLYVESLIDAQERDDSFRYWEGAIRVSGTQSNQPINGLGYLELTGY